MSYTTQSGHVWQMLSSTTPDVLSATGDCAEILVVQRPIRIIAIGIGITTTTTVSAATIKHDRRVLTGSDAGRGDGDVGTLTIPIGAAAGKVYINFITPFDANPGDEIVPEVTATATAGAGRHFIVYQLRDEVTGNLGDQVVVTA
jgi:hypothetical protein